MIMSMIIGAATKLLGSFGQGAINSWLSHLRSKDVQWTKRWIVAAQTEAELQKASMDYRISLLNTNVGAFLVLLIVGPPALHWSLVWFDTIWISFGFAAIGIAKAPADYATLGRDIMLTFIGVKGVASVSGVVMKGLKK